MTAPDAQPPPVTYWSPSQGWLWPDADGRITSLDMGELATWGRNLPADAVRLTADEMAADILDANERMGEALVAIGMALGLPAPRTGATWGAPEILARISASAALAGTTTPTDGAALPALTRLLMVAETLDTAAEAEDLDVEDMAETLRANAEVLREISALLASTPTEETDGEH